MDGKILITSLIGGFLALLAMVVGIQLVSEDTGLPRTGGYQSKIGGFAVFFLVWGLLSFGFACALMIERWCDRTFDD